MMTLNNLYDDDKIVSMTSYLLLKSDDASGSGVVHWSAVCLGVAALNEFVRINWTTTTEKDCGKSPLNNDLFRQRNVTA